MRPARLDFITVFGAATDNTDRMAVALRIRLRTASAMSMDEDPDNFELRAVAEMTWIALRSLSDKAIQAFPRARERDFPRRVAAMREMEHAAGFVEGQLTRPCNRVLHVLHAGFAYNNRGVRTDIIVEIEEALAVLEAVGPRVDAIWRARRGR